jgi:RimJ/RimL family protein N-acetyltransferase
MSLGLSGAGAAGGGAAARWVEPVVLQGSVVRLEPLSHDHLPGLIEIGLDERVWRWLLSPFETEADMRRWVESALAEAGGGREVPFATIERTSGHVVGSTRYLSIVPIHRRLEIGYTWLGVRWQGTAVNSEAKLLMLRHAFEVLGALRVEFKTDSRNAQSRRALAGIGAVEEGTLRNHMLTAGGRRRHSTYFSVIEEEWPAIRAHLEARIERLAG